MYAAHRGYHAHATENSLNAMKAAVRWHANYLEMDVQATSDGRFFLMHDETVTRTTNGRGRIRDKTAQQVNGLRLNDGEHVPSLSRVLDMAKPTRVQVMLEMKWIPPSLMPTLESRIEDFGTSRVVLHSFSGDAVHEFRGLYPDTDIRTALDTGQLHQRRRSGRLRRRPPRLPDHHQHLAVGPQGSRRPRLRVDRRQHPHLEPLRRSGGRHRHQPRVDLRHLPGRHC